MKGLSKHRQGSFVPDLGQRYECILWNDRILTLQRLDERRHGFPGFFAYRSQSFRGDVAGNLLFILEKVEELGNTDLPKGAERTERSRCRKSGLLVLAFQVSSQARDRRGVIWIDRGKGFGRRGPYV